eukprot:TRINITY_DN6376_c0_g1_i1.p1 TRINITY_DN6376_c0_g1~~TRINITY_DN6376_c0_g1_i1.p1  ORF type:complete len:1088 (-),score=184.34 TRINITY_DN6376_c0_g1_i1:2325-5588(-)
MQTPPPALHGDFQGFTTGSGRKINAATSAQLQRALSLMPDLVSMLPAHEASDDAVSDAAEPKPTVATAEMDVESASHTLVREQEMVAEEVGMVVTPLRPLHRRIFVPFDVCRRGASSSPVGGGSSTMDAKPRATPRNAMFWKPPLESPLHTASELILPLRESPKRHTPEPAEDDSCQSDPMKDTPMSHHLNHSAFKTPRISEGFGDAPISFGFTTGSGKSVAPPSDEQMQAWRKKLQLDDIILPISQSSHDPIVTPTKDEHVALNKQIQYSTPSPNESLVARSPSSASPSPSPSLSPSAQPSFQPVVENTRASNFNSKPAPRPNPVAMMGNGKKQFKPPRSIKKESAPTPPTPSEPQLNGTLHSPSPSAVHGDRIFSQIRSQVQPSPITSTANALSSSLFVASPSEEHIITSTPEDTLANLPPRRLFQSPLQQKTKPDEPSQNESIYEDDFFQSDTFRNEFDLSDFDPQSTPTSDCIGPSFWRPERMELQTYMPLLKSGFTRDVLDINSHNASEYMFRKSDCLEHGLQVDHDRIGWKEMMEMLKPDLCLGSLGCEWFKNHYRWIVWKLASQSRRFSLSLGPGHFNPKSVLGQLRHRYKKEVIQAKRSALKKIIEGDDSAYRHLVLCVSSLHIGRDVKDISLELTDGWYSIQTILDEPLQQLVDLHKIYEGQKLHISNSKLTGSGDNCSPLENNGRWKLQIHLNSVRRARWNTRLGFQKDALRINLESIHPGGGPVAACEVVILRTYPTQYMETLSDGSKVIRSAFGEEAASANFQNYRSEVVTKLQKNIVQTRKINGDPKYQRFDRLLYNEDGDCSFSILSAEDRAEFLAYKEQKLSEQNVSLQRAMQEDPSLERKVTPFTQIRVMDALGELTDTRKTALITIWRLGDEASEIFSEGMKAMFINLSVAKSRSGDQNDQTLRLSLSGHMWYETSKAISPLFTPRVHTSFLNLDQLAEYDEFDTAGIVLACTSKREIISRTGRTSFLRTILLMDESGTKLSVDQWMGNEEAQSIVEVKPMTILCFSNLSFRRFDGNIPAYIAVHTDLTIASVNPQKLHLKAARAKCYQYSRWNGEMLKQEVERYSSEYA